MPSLYDVAREYRLRLLDREAAAVADMESSYRKATDNGLKRLLVLVERMSEAEAAGEDTATLNDLFTRLMAIQDQIQDELKRWAPGAASIATRAQSEAVDVAGQMQLPFATAASGAPSEAAMATVWNRFDPMSVEQFIGFASDGTPLDMLFQDIGPSMKQMIANGIIQGDHNTVVARRMAMAYSNLAPARAKTIARTEMLRASREAQRQSFQANSDIVSGWMRASAGDHNVCPACWALHGTRQDLATIVPTHPNCRCTIVPVMAPWQGQSTSDLIPNAETTFSRLSPERQQEALGRGRYMLYKTGTPLSAFGRVVDNAQWGPIAEIVPLRELIQR
jgi:SPP1 gp7 family putative phage head morphogenesis protein